MKKTVGELVDALSVTNIKIFMLVDKVQQDKHTREDSKRLQELNSYRSQLMNAVNEEFGQRTEVKI